MILLGETWYVFYCVCLSMCVCGFVCVTSAILSSVLQEIIYSGHSTPLEGEHKILQHIRKCRASKLYRPNQRHCMVGQDADLIMLGLVTHEPHFTILREVITFTKKPPKTGNVTVPDLDVSGVKFQLLHLSVLREYIEVEFSRRHQGPPLDRERLVDDFVFLTFLVGNDFIPHIPSMDIAENAFDIIFNAYKSLQSSGQVGYIVENGEIGDYDRLEKLFAIIGAQEELVLRKRDKLHKKHMTPKTDLSMSLDGKDAFPLAGGEDSSDGGEELEDEGGSVGVGEIYNTDDSDRDGVLEFSGDSVVFDDTVVDIEPFEEGGEDVVLVGAESHLDFGQYIPTMDNSNVDSSGNYIDTGKIYEESSLHKDFNYRNHHYKSKFNVDPDAPGQEAFVEKITEEYLRGLLWCLAYYFKGCPSWSWYFPYYYGPTLIDMKNLYVKRTLIQFQLDEPFTPFQQLLGCLPPTSSAILPKAYQRLMTDPSSPIADFYPSSFVEDLDGKKNYWEAVVLLKFIDSARLRDAEESLGLKESLTPAEAARNTFGPSLYYKVSPEGNVLEMRDIPFSIKPMKAFKSTLVPGTVIPYRDFPSLRSLPIKFVFMRFLTTKFSGMRYRTLILGLSSKLCPVGRSEPSQLVGRTVYVNYPLNHEAKVIAVSTEHKKYTLHPSSDQPGEGSLTTSNSQALAGIAVAENAFRVNEEVHDIDEQLSWKAQNEVDIRKHLLGFRKVGAAGLAIPNIHTRVIVVPVIGKRLNSITGKIETIYSERKLDVPIHMVNWRNPTALLKKANAKSSIQSPLGNEPKDSPGETRLPRKVGGRRGRFPSPFPELKVLFDQSRRRYGTLMTPHALPRTRLVTFPLRFLSQQRRVLFTAGIRSVLFIGRKCKF